MFLPCNWNSASGAMFSSLAQSCPTLCDPMNYSRPSLPVHHQPPELAQTPVYQVGDAISSSVVPFSSCLQSFLASGSFPMSQLFASCGQSIRASGFHTTLHTTTIFTLLSNFPFAFISSSPPPSPLFQASYPFFPSIPSFLPLLHVP